MPHTKHFEIPLTKATSLKIGDRVKVLVMGEVQGLSGLVPLGDEDGTQMPTDVLSPQVEVTVRSTKVTKRADDDQQEAFEMLAVDEDEDD